MYEASEGGNPVGTVYQREVGGCEAGQMSICQELQHDYGGPDIPTVADVKKAARSATPYLVACLRGGLAGSFGGPTAAAVGCGVDVFAEVARDTGNPWVARSAFAIQVVEALRDGRDIRVAQRNPGIPVGAWREFLSRLSVALRH